MANDPPVVALTGASGFIGGWIARHLVDSGWRVRVLVRPGSEKRLPPSVPLELCSGSLEDLPSLEYLVEGVDGVVHCAGRVRGLTQSDFNTVNAEGTARLVKLAAQQRGTRFLLISSLAAREPRLSPYAASKKKAETYLEKTGNDLSWVVLRPPAVYGPGDKEMRSLLRAMARGVVPVIGSPNARFSLLYVEDLARAVSALLGHRQLSGEIFELDDGKPGGYDWKEIIEIASSLRGGRAIGIPLPEGLLRLAAHVLAATAKISGKAPMLTPAKVNELRHPDWVCDNTAICRLLNWQPQISFAAGLPITLASDQQNAMVR